MNWLAFWASIIKSLAWPALIFILVVMFWRRGMTLKSVIDAGREHFKSIKIVGVEVTFNKARQDAEAVAQELGTPLETVVSPTDQIVQLAEINPGLAVLEIWKRLEAKLYDLSKDYGFDRKQSPQAVVRRLIEDGRIPIREASLFDRLRSIRNEVVHSREPQPLTMAEVIEYRSFVDTFIKRLDQILEELANPTS